MSDDLRKIIVSPQINCPEPFRGFGGFCGWPRICRLHNGDLYVTFSAGYWHASWVNPRPDLPPDYAHYMEDHMAGGATWDAPTGGHIMWTRSSDDGATWTRPRDLAVIPDAYAAGAIMQHSDGTMYAAALIQSGHYWAGHLPTDSIEFLRRMEETFPEQVVILQSIDLGESWREVSRTSGPFLTRLEHPCSITEASDGSLLMLLDGHAAPRDPGHWINALLHSGDQGQSWQTRSIFGDPGRDMEEGHLAVLPDGRIGTASRPWGLWMTSADEGYTWTQPRQLLAFEVPADRSHPNAFKKGDLVVLSDGTLVQLTCGGPGGNGQVLYSRDCGENWTTAAPDRGFQADRFAYYPSACVLPDDSIFMVGDHQGFENKHGPFGAEVVARRFRILAAAEGEGIEILPIDSDLHMPSGVHVDSGNRADRIL